MDWRLARVFLNLGVTAWGLRIPNIAGPQTEPRWPHSLEHEAIYNHVGWTKLVMICSSRLRSFTSGSMATRNVSSSLAGSTPAGSDESSLASGCLTDRETPLSVTLVTLTGGNMCVRGGPTPRPLACGVRSWGVCTVPTRGWTEAIAEGGKRPWRDGRGGPCSSAPWDYSNTVWLE